jgi:hypothetical protein
MTWNVPHASSVASGRWPNSGGGLRDIFCEGFRDSFGAVPFSGVGALSAADFASSGDMLEAREEALAPLGALEPLLSSRFNLMPLGFCFSSVASPAAAPEARLLPSMRPNGAREAPTSRSRLSVEGRRRPKIRGRCSNGKGRVRKRRRRGTKTACARASEVAGGGREGVAERGGRSRSVGDGSGGKGSYSAARPARDMATGSNAKTDGRVQASARGGCAAAGRSLASQN